MVNIVLIMKYIHKIVDSIIEFLKESYVFGLPNSYFFVHHLLEMLIPSDYGPARRYILFKQLHHFLIRIGKLFLQNSSCSRGASGLLRI